MEHGLEVDSVIKEFGEKTVLADVYLHCRPGEIIWSVSVEMEPENLRY